MDDAFIIELYWNRDENAITETNKKYGDFCNAIAMNILSVREDAEECVNDTYQKAWTTIPPQRPNAFRAWLGKVCRNLSINRYHQNRAAKRYGATDELLSELCDCIPDSQTIESIIETRELSEHISNWLETLSSTDRALFVRRYWCTESLSTLAPMIGTTPNKLAGRMFRLRKSLQTYLAKRGIEL